MSSFQAQIRNKDFVLFWFAQLISQFGDRMNQMALVGLAAMRNPGDVTELAKLLAFTIIPVFIVGPIAGVFVDRWDRRVTLLISDLIRGVLVLLIPTIFIFHQSNIPIYIIIFLVFCLSRFHVPAKLSILPDLVEDKHIHTANSLMTVTGMIAAVLGALIGGLIVEYIGPRGGFMIDAMTFLFSALLIIFIKDRPQFKINAQDMAQTGHDIFEAEKTVWHEIKEGVLYILQEKRIQFILSVMTILFMALGAIYVTIIVFVQEAFNTVTKDVAFLAVGLGIGLFIGSMIYGKFGSKQSDIKTIFQSLIGGGVMVSIFTLAVQSTQSRMVGIVMAGILGLVIGPVMIASNTVIHKICNETMRGKVFSALEFVMHLGFLMTMLLSSYLADMVGQFWILLSVGIIFFMIGLVGLIKAKR